MDKISRRGYFPPASLAGQFVAKPYHYGPLFRKIEGLLDEARRAPTDGARWRRFGTLELPITAAE